MNSIPNSHSPHVDQPKDPLQISDSEEAEHDEGVAADLKEERCWLHPQSQVLAIAVQFHCVLKQHACVDLVMSVVLYSFQEPAQQAKAKAEAKVAKEQVQGGLPESKGKEGEDGPPADGAEGKDGPPADGGERKDGPPADGDERKEGLPSPSAPVDGVQRAARQHPQILVNLSCHTELSMPQPRQGKKHLVAPAHQLVLTLLGEALLTHRHLSTGSWLRRTHGSSHLARICFVSSVHMLENPY